MSRLTAFSQHSVSKSEDIAEICRLLKVLGNPNRLEILLFLVDKEITVGDIETSLSFKQPNLSHELKKLRDAGFVATKRQSKTIFYRLKSESIKTLLLAVCRATNTPLYIDEQLTPPNHITKDSKATECSLFANVPLQLTPRS